MAVVVTPQAAQRWLRGYNPQKLVAHLKTVSPQQQALWLRGAREGAWDQPICDAILSEFGETH